MIPDSPNNLRIQLQRERQTLRETQFQQGQIRSSLYLECPNTNDLLNEENSLGNLRQRRPSLTRTQRRHSLSRSNSVSQISQNMD